MAKKKPEPEQMPAAQPPDAPAAEVNRGVKHARIELPDVDYRRLKDAADRYRLSISAYIRQAVMERIERDEAKR